MGGCGDSACFYFVFGFVVHVFPCQSTGGDPVLFFFCFASMTAPLKTHKSYK